MVKKSQKLTAFFTISLPTGEGAVGFGWIRLDWVGPGWTEWDESDKSDLSDWLTELRQGICAPVNRFFIKFNLVVNVFVY